MKYFSPAILDGSVTTAKLADGAVTRVKVNEGLASQAGSIAIQGKVTVSMDPWSFAPDIEADNPISASLDVDILTRHRTVPAAGSNTPEVDLRNQDTGSARNYSAAWRFVDV